MTDGNHDSTNHSLNSSTPKILQDRSWTDCLTRLCRESADELKIPPYSWTEDRIYLWLLRICDKYHKISPTLVTRLTPFINNFHSGDFGDLDEELRDIIAIEHRRLFDNCLSPVSSPSVYDSEDGLDSLSPTPSVNHQDSPLDRRTTPSLGIPNNFYDPYPPKSPDSGIPGSPQTFIEHQDVYQNHLSPPNQPLPSHSDVIAPWPPYNTIGPMQTSLIPFPQEQHLIPQYPILQEYQHIPPHLYHVSPNQFPIPIESLPICPQPPHPPLETKPQRTKPKKNKKKTGHGRNVTDKVVDTRILETMPSSVQLWEFVLRVLRNPLYSSIISWENQHEGIFHIHDPQALADLWGRHRNHDGMNYDKMSRAMRYYYRRGILEPVRERLTYKFSSRLRQMFFD